MRCLAVIAATTGKDQIVIGQRILGPDGFRHEVVNLPILSAG